MFAVVQAGGKQYRMQPGEVLEVERLAEPAKSQFEFDRVLFCGHGEEFAVGTPLVEGAKVLATILGERKGKKVIAFRYKRRKNERRKRGHRHIYTQVRVDKLVTPFGVEEAPAQEAFAAPAEVEAETEA